MTRRTFLALAAAMPLTLAARYIEVKEMTVRVYRTDLFLDFDGPQYREITHRIYDEDEQDIGIMVFRPAQNQRAVFLRNLQTGKLERKYMVVKFENENTVLPTYCDLYLQPGWGFWRTLLSGKELL